MTWSLRRLPAKQVENLEHSVQGGHYVRLHAAERAPAELGQVRLELADIVPPNRQMPDEVECAFAKLWRSAGEFGRKLRLRGRGGVA
jgi:hypothetical protein